MRISLIFLAITGVNACASVSVLEMQPNVPQGGRAVAVASHPTDDTTFLVASEGGGLFLSTNGAADFDQVTGSHTFWFTDVRFLPSNPTIAIATANRDRRIVSGGAIWRSTDGGQNWTRITITPPVARCLDNLAAYAIAVQASSGRIWVGTSCGLAFSDNAGTIWSYVPTSANYNNDVVSAIIAPSANQLVILTPAGVKVSGNGGTSWSVSNTGLPPGAGAGGNRQIAVSPFAPTHIFRTFNYWKWTQDANGNWSAGPRRGLYWSIDNGNTWSAIFDDGYLNRPPFVRIGGAMAGNQYEVFYGDGGCAVRRGTFTHGSPPVVPATWTSLGFDHCDHSDLAFRSDGHTPSLLVGDGGVHGTNNAGASWTLTGANRKGYHALQITEVTGQFHTGNSGSDLYYGTQDNDIRASPDNGTTWPDPNKRCCEGFFLNVSRTELPPASTRVTGASCGPCGNFISGPLLTNQAAFPNPLSDTGNPRLLEPGAYIQSTAVAGVSATLFALTTDNGANWTTRYGFPEEVRALSQVVGPAGNPVIFTAIKKPGATPSGQEVVGIRRITGVLGTGTPVVSEVTGFGSLGTHATMFAWYKPYGVDPFDANHMIVPDIISSTMKVTRDGGATWSVDGPLSQLVTQNNTFHFRVDEFTQVTTVGFDPDNPGHVLVGTAQGGIIRSTNDGNSWHRIQGSEILPSVSSFFFMKDGGVAVSTYGRGLWKLTFNKRPRLPRVPREVELIEPMVYWKGVLIPLKDLLDPEKCPVCGFYLTRGGEIEEVVVDQRTEEVQVVTLSGGVLQGASSQGAALDVSFDVNQAQRRGKFGNDRKLLALIERGASVRGLLLERRVLKGYVLAKRELTAADLPRHVDMPHYVRINLPIVGGQPSFRVGSAVVLTGEGFDPRSPLEVLYDGQPLPVPVEPRFEPGTTHFVLSIPVFGSVGGHTILVQQRIGDRVIRDAVTFTIVVSDLER